MNSPRLITALLWLGAGWLGSGSAGTALTSIAPAGGATASPAATGILIGKLAEGSPYDRMWSLPTLYQNARHPYLQLLAIQGQLQTQYAYGSDASGQYGSADMPTASRWDDVEVRRFRLGLKAQLFHDFKFHSLFELYPELTPRMFQYMPEMYLTYAPCDAFNLVAGKTELKFTREQEWSSRDLLPFERSQLVNLFYGGELTGSWVYGKNIAGGWLYELGAYSNDRVDEWTHFHGGTMILAKTGYNYTKASGCDYAQAEFHFLHNTEPGYTESSKHAASPLFSDCIAISNDLTKGRFSLATEGFWGAGKDRPNVGGITVMPACFLAEKLQLVTTFQFAASSGDNGISLPTRYELQVPGGKNMIGDTYFAGYAGLNYYLYGHKLKVMSGVKYSSMTGGAEDFSGWTWLAGFRTAF